MHGDSAAHLPVLSQLQAKELMGKTLTVNGTTYRFKERDPAQPGQWPWRSGAEGKAYPLLNSNGEVHSYLKFFNRITPKRMHRAEWLISQRMHVWQDTLAGSPNCWVDTRTLSRPDGVTFDFVGYIAAAVPGETWLEAKYRVAEGGIRWDDNLRWRCVRYLVAATAVLEHKGFVHGDLSPNNILVDMTAPRGRSPIFLIDFDAFVTHTGGALSSVSVAEGGTYGTDGYCPVDLSSRVMVGDTGVFPYSDRFGRDMLLLELLCFGREFPSDEPPAKWEWSKTRRRLAAILSRLPNEAGVHLQFLARQEILAIPEATRPNSLELANALGLFRERLPVREFAPLQRLSAARPRYPVTEVAQNSPTGSSPPDDIPTLPPMKPNVTQKSPGAQTPRSRQSMVTGARLPTGGELSFDLATRMRIFTELIKLQDAGLTSHESRLEIAAKYNTTPATITDIAREARQCRWPLPLLPSV